MSLNEFILYQSSDGKTRIDVRLSEQTVWLTQSQMAELFQTTKQNISLHLKNIFTEGELKQEAVVKDYLTTASDGKTYNTLHYNLDSIIAIGYRVKSKRGTQFRQWATTILKDYLVKGYVMNDERLKEPAGWDYFDELLERIREIRASEKRFYQKVRDIYSTSVDYDAKSEQAQLFFKTVQNKMLFAVTGKTAAELLISRANSTEPNMGLTSWQGSRVRKQDVTIAKNYLTHKEIIELNRIATMFLDFAEDQAQRRQVMQMKGWEERLDAFLKFNDREVLDHAGKTSHVFAENTALEHYQKFDQARVNVQLEKSENEALQELTELEKMISVTHHKKTTKKKKV